MKIAVLTLPLHTNYGGILQAYALQTVLKRMGHEVWLIDEGKTKWTIPLWEKPLSYTKRAMKKYFFNKKEVVIFIENELNKTFEITTRYVRPFIKDNIDSIDLKKGKHLLIEKEFDAIVVGSDQIWRPKFYSAIEIAFLNFAQKWNIKRISYAASFGTDEIEYTYMQQKKCGELLRLFDAVSVREDSGVELCRKMFGVEAKHVLDPTMLLNLDDYIKLIENSSVQISKGDLMIYILDEDSRKEDIVACVEEKYRLKSFKCNAKDWGLKDVPIEERIQPSVESFLRGFYDAKFVVTDSFHACVFSIIFRKPFCIIGNRSRGMARFDSLLKMFSLEDRMVASPDDISSLCDIDYDEVYKKLDMYKRDSIVFLEKALSE